MTFIYPFSLFLIFLSILQCNCGDYSYKKYKYGGDGYESKEITKQSFIQPSSYIDDADYKRKKCIYGKQELGCNDKKIIPIKHYKNIKFFKNYEYHNNYDKFDLNSVCHYKTGLVPNKLDCCSFISCSNGIAHILKCGPGTIFNSLKLVCDYPHQAKCVANNPDCAQKMLKYNIKKSQW